MQVASHVGTTVHLVHKCRLRHSTAGYSRSLPCFSVSTPRQQTSSGAMRAIPMPMQGFHVATSAIHFCMHLKGGEQFDALVPLKALVLTRPGRFKV